MSSLSYWISDSQLNEELGFYLKRRDVEQKFAYLGGGARSYYGAYGNAESKSKSSSEGLNYTRLSHLDFLHKHIPEEKLNKKFALISLGCGNGFQEKDLLQKLADKGYNFDYIGVDCSKSMLELAEKNLCDINTGKKKFICADFSSTHFLQEMKSLTAKYPTSIFAFLGWTFCNTDQTSMTDALYNMLGKDDYLCFDVLSRKGENQNIKMKLFNRYTSYLTNEEMNKFQFSALKSVGIPFSHGKMILETSNNDAMGAMVYNFSFMFTKTTVITYRGEIIHFLAGEKIKVYSIRNYDTNKLVNFFMEHDFQLVGLESGMISDWLQESQFLFKKADHN